MKHAAYPIKVIPGIYLLNTYQHVPGGRIINQEAVYFFARKGRGVLHTPQNVPGRRIISQGTTQFFARMGRGVLHTPLRVPSRRFNG